MYVLRLCRCVFVIGLLIVLLVSLFFTYLVVWLISDIVFSFTLLFYLWLFGLFGFLLWFVYSGLAV